MADLADQLSGNRLALRRWAPEHLSALLETVQSSYEELHRWMSWAASPPTVPSIRDVIEKSVRKFDENARWNYGLFEIATEACVGSASLRTTDVPEELEIGYWVRTDRTGRGYATEAARVLTAAAFAAPLNVARVRISMDGTNLASASVPRKLGYHREGPTQRERLAPGHTGNGALWTVTRDEWRLRDGS
jgi:ribosomal-protein-serine acetyltransferase